MDKWRSALVFLILVLGGCSTEKSVAPKGIDLAVTDLRVVEVRDSALTIVWTSPGNDGTARQAVRYDIRTSSTPLTPAHWDEADHLLFPPAPRHPGLPETLLVQGLLPGTLHYFALRVMDSDSTWTAVSNVASKVTSGLLRLFDCWPERPSWSPNSQWICFVANGSLVATISSSGGRAALIYSGVGVMWSSWSPTGDRIAVEVSGGMAVTEIILVPATGGVATPLDLPECYLPERPTWSPDGTELAFTEGDYFMGVAVAPATGGTWRELVGGLDLADAPSWSPDGSKIVFVAKTDNQWLLEVCPTQGGRGVVVYRGRATSPVFSPDGRWIAFVAMHCTSDSIDSCDCEIRIMPAEGGESFRLEIPGLAETEQLRAIAWSPDGTRLALVTDRNLPSSFPPWLYVMAAPTLEQ